MKFIKYFVLITLLIPFSIQSQVKKNLEIGLDYGYRLNQFNLIIGYKLIPNNLTLNLDLNDDKYQGYGTGLHFDYYPLEKNIINPFVGFGISRNVGRKYSFDRVTDSVTDFEISGANYIAPFIGLKYNDVMVDVKKVARMGMFIKIGYKNNFSSSPNVSYISGPEDNSKLNDIHNYIKNGIIGSIGVIISWGK